MWASWLLPATIETTALPAVVKLSSASKGNAAALKERRKLQNCTESTRGALLGAGVAAGEASMLLPAGPGGSQSAPARIFSRQKRRDECRHGSGARGPAFGENRIRRSWRSRTTDPRIVLGLNNRKVRRNDGAASLLHTDEVG